MIQNWGAAGAHSCEAWALCAPTAGWVPGATAVHIDAGTFVLEVHTHLWRAAYFEFVCIWSHDNV